VTNLEKLQSLDSDEKLEFLAEFIGNWAGIESRNGSYIYDLTICKEGFAYGTMRWEDFIEWDDDRVADVAKEFLQWLNASD